MIRNNRIDTLVEQTKGIKRLLDIGTDHGLVIKKALDKKYIESAIASDINIKPLNMALQNLKKYKNVVEFTVSDGFNDIKSIYDGVMIAGMGSNLISEILKDAKEDKNIKYILQANNKYDVLREYLSFNNFKIIDETVIFDKFYYVIIVAVRANKKLTKKEIFLGPILKTKKESINYYKDLLNKYQLIIEENPLAADNFNDKINWLKEELGKEA